MLADTAMVMILPVVRGIAVVMLVTNPSVPAISGTVEARVLESYSISKSETPSHQSVQLNWQLPNRRPNDDLSKGRGQKKLLKQGLSVVRINGGIAVEAIAYYPSACYTPGPLVQMPNTSNNRSRIEFLASVHYEEGSICVQSVVPLTFRKFLPDELDARYFVVKLRNERSGRVKKLSAHISELQ